MMEREQCAFVSNLIFQNNSQIRDELKLNNKSTKVKSGWFETAMYIVDKYEKHK